MFERYTERARRSLFFARYEASVLGSPTIEIEHLLLGLAREEGGLTAVIFASHRLSPAILRDKLAPGRTRAAKISTSIEMPFSQESKRALQLAAEEADRLLHVHIGTEHLLLGILRVQRSAAAQLMAEYGLRVDNVREEIVGLLNERAASDATLNAIERLEQIKALVARVGEVSAGNEEASQLLARILRDLDALRPYLEP